MTSEPNNPEDLTESGASSKITLLTAIGTGLLFWTSLFGILFFCLRT